MIVRLKGGLGNQMFIYAFVRKMQLSYGIKIKIDKSFFEYIDELGGAFLIDDFDVLYDVASEEEINKVCLFKHKQKPRTFLYRVFIFLESKLNKKYYRIKNFQYVNPVELLNYSYLDGSWQSWKYLDGIENVIKREFVLKKPLSEKINKQIAEASNCESVFIGIRKGDYTNPENVKLYGSLSDNYYNEAIKIIKAKHPDAKFYIMSDDIEWVKKNIKFDCEPIYRTDEMVGTGQEEMMFMKSCKHAIISNSTFHWWGAWLIDNPNKIIVAPKEWFADGTKIDILPPNWELVSRFN